MIYEIIEFSRMVEEKRSSEERLDVSGTVMKIMDEVLKTE